MEGWKYELNNNDIEFGSAVHKFIYAAKQLGVGKGLAAASAYFKRPSIIKERKQYMDEAFLRYVCMEYWDKYGDGKDIHETIFHDGQICAELTFSIPFYVDNHVEILLEGTIDDLCQTKRGGFALRDYKTTSTTDVDKYLRGYSLSTQLYFYHHAIKWYAQHYPDSIIGRFGRSNFAFIIDGIFLRGKDKPPEFIRSSAIFPSEQRIVQFKELLEATCKRISVAVQRGQLPHPEGLVQGLCAGASFDHCKYFTFCSSPDEQCGRAWLNKTMIQKTYDPIASKD